MLSFFRRGIWAKLMLVVLGIGLFAIVVTGFGTGGIGGLGAIGGGSSSIASVDGEAISEADVSDQVRRQLKRTQQQQPTLDMASFLRGGALEEIVNQLVTVTSRLVFGRDQGLSASKALVDREILSISAFQNAAGTFDENAFQQVLQREGISEAKLREEIATSLVERQLMLPVASSAQVPDGLALNYASLLLENRNGIAGVVPVALMGRGNEPTEAEIAAFFRSNQGRYTIPERRVIRYAVFGAEQVAAASTPTDAEVAAAYRQNASAYAAKENRKLSQVVLPTEAAARAFAAKLAGGMSFAAAAAQIGYTAADTTLPEQDKAAYSRTASPAVANAAFAAAKGSTTAPVKSPLGWHIVLVEDVKTIPGRSLDAVRAELAAQLKLTKGQDALADLTNRIENALADSNNIDEVARAQKLAIVQTPPVTAAGAAPDVPAWRAPPELQPLLESAFDMTEDDDPVVEQIVPNQRFAMLAVARVVPAAPPPFAQIRERVKADFVAKRALDRARAVAAALVAKINAGTAPAAAFAQSDIRLPPVTQISATRRDIAQQRPGQSIPPAMMMLFSLPQGKARLIPAPQGTGWIVVYLDRIVPGDARREPQLIQAVRTQFAQVVGDEYVQQFTNAIQAGMKVKRNPQKLADLRARLSQNGTAQ
jgi:peptidyl-prolyl cis-trans isomerase D